MSASLHTQNTQFYIGVLSGTSIDSIDAAIIHFHDNKIKVIHTHSHDIPAELKAKTLHLSQVGQTTLQLFGELDTQWGLLFAESINALLTQSQIPIEQIAAVGSHGQTLWHQPTGDAPFSLQIGNPHIIAKKTGLITVSDFRRGDIALGGQGAPLVPRFHQAYFQSAEIDRIIINLGGIANISLLPTDPNQPIIGFDTGPANSLLDSWCALHQNKAYDSNGKWAQSGEIQIELLNHLLADPYFALPYPKSTGKDYFNIAWLKKSLENNLAPVSPISPQDIQATLTELTACTLSNAIKSTHPKAAELFLCGGGVHNAYLCSRIQHHLGPNYPLYTTEQLGVAPDWVEAACFAWLAKAHMDNQAIDYRAITQAARPTVLGSRCFP